ncbi:adenylyltransferase/cytidyltransferase family protein [Facilibium subflavum]|uniref:adenylyltransferase/cytidyltransferase family protein n=1 Tax=Facilibium subflavum TaxID=2219058 RepID=UPI000E65E8D9|nr:adenylyltransferase/cytidyltransferase family protein [Facilibium subflavum]
MPTVITYGTFDLFHFGHLELLRRCAEYGKLIVGVSTDEFNQQKGKKTVIPYKERSQIINAIKYVDSVFKEESWEQKIEDISKFQADYFIIGDDWKGKFDYLEKESSCKGAHSEFVGK